MFSQAQIEEWLGLTDASIHLESNDLVEMGLTTNGAVRDLKVFLVELRSQVERWDLLTTNYIFHPVLEQYILQTLVKDTDYTNTNTISGTQMRIWGTDLTVSTFMPIDKVLAIDIQTLNPILPKCVALGKIDIKQIERLHNLKAFW